MQQNLSEKKHLYCETDREKMCALAFSHLQDAYAPYSHFHVSSAVLMDSGKIYFGVNIENASYPCGICAERNAIFKAISEGERRISAILIVGGTEGRVSDYCPPCGICLQVIREFSDPDETIIILAKSETEYQEYKLCELLPHSFGPENL